MNTAVPACNTSAQRLNASKSHRSIDGDLQWKGGEITDLRRVIDGLIAVRYWSEGP